MKHLGKLVIVFVVLLSIVGNLTAVAESRPEKSETIVLPINLSDEVLEYTNGLIFSEGNENAFRQSVNERSSGKLIFHYEIDELNDDDIVISGNGVIRIGTETYPYNFTDQHVELLPLSSGDVSFYGPVHVNVSIRGEEKTGIVGVNHCTSLDESFFSVTIGDMSNDEGIAAAYFGVHSKATKEADLVFAERLRSTNSAQDVEFDDESSMLSSEYLNYKTGSASSVVQGPDGNTATNHRSIIVQAYHADRYWGLGTTHVRAFTDRRSVTDYIIKNGFYQGNPDAETYQLNVSFRQLYPSNDRHIVMEPSYPLDSEKIKTHNWNLFINNQIIQMATNALFALYNSNLPISTVNRVYGTYGNEIGHTKLVRYVNGTSDINTTSSTTAASLADNREEGFTVRFTYNRAPTLSNRDTYRVEAMATYWGYNGYLTQWFYSPTQPASFAYTYPME